MYIHGMDYFWNYRKFDSTDIRISTAIRSYANFLFKSNQLLPFLLFSDGNEIYSRREWKRYLLHALRNLSVDADIYLAEYYLRDTHRNEHKMKRHLRIAAESGHSDAQTICRQLFGRRNSVSRGISLLEGKRDISRGEERLQPRTK